MGEELIIFLHYTFNHIFELLVEAVTVRGGDKLFLVSSPSYIVGREAGK